jgi:shikimate kinase
MGVGKTTVGTMLATRLGLRFHDSDAMISTSTGRTGADIARAEGVEALHDVELSTFLGMVDRDEPSVIAPAASVVDSEAGREAMRRHTTVWLVASEDVTAQRMNAEDHRRPYAPGERDRLWGDRRPHLERIAATTIDTSSRQPAEVADEIVRWLGSSDHL